jgi:N-acetyl-alpha-D-muramate 1-phosphate uridylyltransferase
MMQRATPREPCRWRPRRAMVLAAGLGQRMRPLTDTVPKPLVRLHGRALIDHVLDRLAEAGIEEAVVNVHYLADALESHLSRRTRPAVLISDERDALLDTGGGVVRALPLLGPEPFLIHNSDSVWSDGPDSSLDRFFRAWDPARMDSLMLLALASQSLGYAGRGDFLMDASGRLQRRPEPETAPFVFAGVSIAHPRLFDDAPAGRFSLNHLWDRAIDRGRLFGVRLDGLWMHIGSPQALADAERWVEREDVG